MFKIGEFSKLVRVSARMLRYYEKCGLLSPAEIDRFTGYRMYSAAQIPLLSRIVTLRDMGFGVEEIEEILPFYDNAAYMRKALHKKRGQIVDTVANEQSKLRKIAAMSGELREEYISMVYDIELKSLQAEKVISVRETIRAEKEDALWEKLWDYITKNNIKYGTGGYSVYHGDEYDESDVDTEIAVPVFELGENKDGFVYKELAAIPQAATVRFSGPYEGSNEAYQKLALWVEQNGYTVDGSFRGYAIATAADVKSPDDYMTEIQVPVKKA